MADRPFISRGLHPGPGLEHARFGDPVTQQLSRRLAAACAASHAVRRPARVWIGALLAGAIGALLGWCLRFDPGELRQAPLQGPRFAARMGYAPGLLPPESGSEPDAGELSAS